MGSPLQDGEKKERVFKRISGQNSFGRNVAYLSKGGGRSLRPRLIGRSETSYRKGAERKKTLIKRKLPEGHKNQPTKDSIFPAEALSLV